MAMWNSVGFLWKGQKSADKSHDVSVTPRLWDFFFSPFWTRIGPKMKSPLKHLGTIASRCPRRFKEDSRFFFSPLGTIGALMKSSLKPLGTIMSRCPRRFGTIGALIRSPLKLPVTIMSRRTIMHRRFRGALTWCWETPVSRRAVRLIVAEFIHLCMKPGNM